MRETLHLFHTNDLHSHFENWPKIAQYIETKRNELQKKNEESLVFDIGDHVDRFQMISEATFGKANIELLNDICCDGATIGNNEGITLPHEKLDTLYSDAKFPIVLSNLYDFNGKRPDWLKPYYIKTLKNNMKLAILGVTVSYYDVYEVLNWKVTDPFESISEVINEVREQADIIVLLSHLGISDDILAAKRFPEIDVILGSHTHHLLENGQYENGVLLGCAEKYGHFVGHIELQLDSETKTIHGKKASVQKVEDLTESSIRAKDFLQKEEKKASEILNQEVATISSTLEVNWFYSSSLPKLLAEALKEWCGTEIGMVNSGVILQSLEKGPVTRKDLHSICPHPINPIKVFLEGDELKEIILHAATDQMEQFQIKGLGFRGEVMGKMMYSGIELETERLQDGLVHVKSILINQEPLVPDRVYSVGTIDMFTLGSFFPSIRNASNKIYFMPEFLRDLLAWKLSKA
ncbi:bifunctional UDP-sugar hydrolase/5'-nucleotidase [Bacillus gobiensis]|uniref:bifunctional metallophosphatase/5'-nucleotidase n=1 Tax=Bacillus gobiensis TaxID=1441095 RepID=UPI003D24054C